MNRKVLLSLGCLLVLLVTHAAVGQDIFKQEDNQYSTRELVRTTPLPRGSRIVIKSAETLRGLLTITASDAGEARLKYFKQAKTTIKSRAIDYIDLIDVSMEKTPGGLQLELRAPNPAPWSADEAGTLTGELFVPEGCDIEINAAYFDIDATGPFRTMSIPSSLGRLTVENVTDLCELSTSNRRLTVTNILGQISAATTNSTLTATRINCGDNKAVFRNDGGDIKIEGLTGEANVKNNYGRIDVEDYHPTGNNNYIRSSNGPIMVYITKMSGGQLLLSNQYEDIDITIPEAISATLSLAVEEEGKIEVSNLPFKPEVIQQNRLNLVAGRGDALINGSVRGKGNIYVRGSDEGN